MDLTNVVRKHLALLAVCVVLACSAVNAGATEMGGGAYPNGAEGIMAGALPPPGLYYLNYLTHYSADRLNDGNGDRIPVDIKLDATANVFRFVYMTKQQLLGGSYGMYMLLPLVHVSATLTTPGGTVSSTDSGLGDISFSPFVLAWHGKNWHAATALDVTAPTGQYDTTRLANIGRNYWTIQPVLAGTLLSDNGFELSGKFMYDFNTKNTDTSYKSGQEFHFDYAAAYHTGPWSFGAAGYYYKQITDDEVYGTTVAPDGNKGQVLAVGPAVKYDYKNMSLEARYQIETLVENRPEGDKLWLKLVWAF